MKIMNNAQKWRIPREYNINESTFTLELKEDLEDEKEKQKSIQVYKHYYKRLSVHCLSVLREYFKATIKSTHIVWGVSLVL